MSATPNSAVAEALRLLGKSDLLLAVHDASFPGVAGEDAGRGTPYGLGGQALAKFARTLGFTGLQLGPQGQTSPVNSSPYDGTLFSRNTMSLDLRSLVCDGMWGGLLSEETLRKMVEENPRPDGCRVVYDYAFAAYDYAADEIYRRFTARHRQGEPEALRLAGALAIFWRENRWLRDDALYEALCLKHARRPWFQWPKTGEHALDWRLPVSSGCASAAPYRRSLEQLYAGLIERYTLIQFVLLEQHHAYHGHMQELGLKIYGDVQVGFSLRDAWSLQDLVLHDYFLGAPPSRTNPAGQPWSHPVLDPARYMDAAGGSGPVLEFVTARLDKMLTEFDGLRLDHPHGLVCPWVYRADDPDPCHAVQNGARLFSSPDLPEHPNLARHAIVRPEQLDRQRPRFADDWVRYLTPEQENRYALIMDVLIAQVSAHDRRKEDILCEVLSTEPLPLRQVRMRHGLGRFRVTQKANLDDPRDVYRSENAQPEDWVMVGNHDTPSIWSLAKTWHGKAEGRKQADYLARRLRQEAPETLAALLAMDPNRLAHAKVAELFLSPARHVILFFADLLGLVETYNVPGTVNADNWTLRVPPDFVREHGRKSRQGAALNLHAVLALALRARPDIVCPGLIGRLEEEAGWRIDA